MKHPLKLIIFGRQGSGKGTQCQKLAKELGIVHISTGDILRENIALATPLGLKIEPVLARGGLVDDDVMQALLEDRLRQNDVVENGFILDGIPRTVRQATSLLSLLGEDGFDVALNLDVAYEEVLKRLQERGREDDSNDSIVERLRLYEEETVPAMQPFKELDLLRVVDGVGSEEEVTDRLLRALGVVIVEEVSFD